MPGTPPTSTGALGVPSVGAALSVVRSFPATPITEAQQKYLITGVSRDSANNPLGSCTVYLFQMISGIPVFVASQVSDATGLFTFMVNPPSTGATYWTASYKTGSPDVGGVSPQNLQGA